MALTLGDNFSYQGTKPLDARLKYDTLADMVAMADSTLYDGCIAYCVATDKTYQWKSTNETSETLGKWAEFNSGGGGSVTVDDNVTEASSNPVKSSGIYSSVVANTDLITDTVGWSGKNLLPYPYSDGTSKTTNGITFTVDSTTGAITASGTATDNANFKVVSYTSGYSLPAGEYILTGCPSGGNGNYLLRADFYESGTYKRVTDTGDGAKEIFSNTVDLGTTGNIFILINSGVTVDNVVFYPMLRKANIVDDTYEPYHEDVESVLSAKMSYADNSILGAKNILTPPQSEGTVNGITYTPNSDGTVSVTGSLLEERTSQYIYKELFTSDGILKAGETYKISKGTTQYAYIILWYWDTNNTNIGVTTTRNKNEEVTFTVPEDTYRINYVLEVVSDDYGQVVDDTLELMIRLASDPDDTYQPYAMTNREITEALANVPTSLDDTVTQSSSNPVKSSGIYAFTDQTYDAASAKPQSGVAVAEALQNVTITTDDTVTQASTNPVKSSGIYTAISAKQSFFNNAGYHNSIYRGDYLGSEFTDAQSTVIQAGTFDDLFIGDYWTIDGVNWIIADFDYYYYAGNPKCTTHHAVIVPETALYSAKMNDSDTTSGAYAGSVMYSTNLETAKTTIESAFGSSHILSHRTYLKNAVTSGYESGGAWYYSTVDLMTEENVYGCTEYKNVICGTNLPYNYTIDKTQYRLFALNRQRIVCTPDSYWLRDVATSTKFCLVNSFSNANHNDASGELGVRPAFCIY